jgi:hypothetical protein
LPVTWFQAGLVAAGVLAVAAVIGWKRDLSEEHLEEAVAGVFPARAAAAVEKRGCTGPLYNDYDWGGYLIWRLPGLPVALDGRANLHGDERILRSVDTWKGKRGWESDPELAAAGVVIAPVDAPLASLLRLDRRRFELVHEDAVSAVFVARNPSKRE